jgi:hypothetical protein
MTGVVARTSKLTATADIASAYSLAYVSQLYVPLQAFIPTSPESGVSQLIGLALLGGVIASFLVIVDPVNKIINRLLPSLLRGPNSPYRVRASQLISKITTGKVAPTPGSENEFYVGRARDSYWTAYMSKWRTKMSDGVIFSMFLFGLVWRASVVVGVELALTIFAVGMIVLYSISRDLRGKIPRYCWIIAVYGLMVQYLTEGAKGNLDRIANHLSEANWPEADWWMVRTVGNN